MGARKPRTVSARTMLKRERTCMAWQVFLLAIHDQATLDVVVPHIIEDADKEGFVYDLASYLKRVMPLKVERYMRAKFNASFIDSEMGNEILALALNAMDCIAWDQPAEELIKFVQSGAYKDPHPVYATLQSEESAKSSAMRASA